MSYTLDTDTCIAYLRGKHPQIRHHVLTHFHDIAVVTHNTGEFLRVAGLLVEDWWI